MQYVLSYLSQHFYFVNFKSVLSTTNNEIIIIINNFFFGDACLDSVSGLEIVLQGGTTYLWERFN